MDLPCPRCGAPLPRSDAPTGTIICASCGVTIGRGAIIASGQPLAGDELARLAELTAREDALRGGGVVNWWRRRKLQREFVDFMRAVRASRRAPPPE